MPLEAGELPPELRARIVARGERLQSDPTFGEALAREAKNANDSAHIVVAQARVELATPHFQWATQGRESVADPGTSPLCVLGDGSDWLLS